MIAGAEKLRYYLDHPVEARRIAVAGHLFALRYHRAVSQADYFLRTAHLALATTSPAAGQDDVEPASARLRPSPWPEQQYGETTGQALLARYDGNKWLVPHGGMTKTKLSEGWQA